MNNQFIKIYGLQDELIPDVRLKNITILQDEIDYDALEQMNPPFINQVLPVKKDVVVQQFISYVFGCIMGRYNLAKHGLQIADPNPTFDELTSYKFNNLTFEIDEDAIIPLMDEDSPFNDNIVSRFKFFLQVVWTEETLTENINFVNMSLGMDIEKYLTEKFWDFHKKMYQRNQFTGCLQVRGR